MTQNAPAAAFRRAAAVVLGDSGAAGIGRHPGTTRFGRVFSYFVLNKVVKTFWEHSSVAEGAGAKSRASVRAALPLVRGFRGGNDGDAVPAL